MKTNGLVNKWIEKTKLENKMIYKRHHKISEMI